MHGRFSTRAQHAGNEDEAIAAVLHDAIDDVPKRLGAQGVRGAIEQRFGADVLKIVEGCTDADIQPKLPWRRRKEQYVRRISNENASTLLVSASDKLHNVRAILSDLSGEVPSARVARQRAPAHGAAGYPVRILRVLRVRQDSGPAESQAPVRSLSTAGPEPSFILLLAQVTPAPTLAELLKLLLG